MSWSAPWLLAGLLAGAEPVDRLDFPGLRETILGGLAYLEDTQIRDRPGRGSPERDASGLGDGCCCRKRLDLAGLGHEAIGLPGGKVRNLPGEWAAFFHSFPTLTGIPDHSPLPTQDSSAFMTASTAYGLLLIDDSALPECRRFVSGMLRLAVANVGTYRRCVGYSFWPQLPGCEASFPRVGPLNFSVPRYRLLMTLMQIVPAGLVPHRLELSREAIRLMKSWNRALFDPCLNPAGMDAGLNVPDDADDTALAVMLQSRFQCRCPGAGVAPDLAALEQVACFRDLGRPCEHYQNRWKPRDTGAYLTWLRDERDQPFARPELGVIPLGVNDVDAVVNANVAHALALTGMKGLPGYDDCLRLLAWVTEKRLWFEAGLYYRQYMIFPYVVSRAYRDGGACEGPMGPAMRRLLVQLLDDQDAYARCRPDRRGAFPGPRDCSDHLSTALGLSALLHLGRGMACELCEAERYDRALADAAAYLIRVRRDCCVSYSSTWASLGESAALAAEWDSGMFFNDTQPLNYFRSSALTAAMVVEALTKFAIGYDLDGGPTGGRRLALLLGPKGLQLAIVE